MKIRVSLQADFAEVRVLMPHPMETGQRKDSSGKLVPLHFIQTFTARLNGKPVFQADLSQAVARDPVFWFRIVGAKAGDKLAISWQDNTGAKRTDEVTIGAGG